MSSEATALTPPVAPTSVPPPDITKDRIAILLGGSLTVMWPHMKHLAATPVAWATLVPIDEPPAPERWPRETHIRVSIDMRIGTVAEIVERFRTELTTAFNVIAMKQEDGSHAVIPQLGEASMRLQTGVFERNGVNKDCTALGPTFKVDPKVFEAREEQRSRMAGFEPRQNIHERNALMCLVATYGDRRYREDGGYGCPTDNPEAVQKLIDALIVFKEDTIARNVRTATPLVPK